MEDQIVVCSKCGGKNRVPASALTATGKAKCGHCGAPLSPASIDEAAGIRAAVIESVPRRREGAGKWVSGIILSILATGAYWFFIANPDQPIFGPDPTTAAASDPASEPSAVFPSPATEPAPFDPAPLAPAEEPAFALPLEPFPLPDPIPLEPAPAPPPALEPMWIAAGIQNNWTGTDAVAPLSIVTSYGQNYYVKLVYAGSSTEAVTYYVEGGSTADFLAPLGTYELRYASGQTWYGQTELFGPDTGYAKAVGTFDFRDDGTQYTGYTVELILQPDGNLDTEGMSRDQF